MKPRCFEAGAPLAITLAAMMALGLAFAMLFTTSTAWAADDASSASAASSQPSASEAAPSSQSMPTDDPASPDSLPIVGGLPLMGNDYVWFGRSLHLHQHAVTNDLIAAGQSVRLASIKAGGSFRVAAQEVTIEDATASENITA